jgi:hypothetical protein
MVFLQATQVWECLLFASGNALAIQKCSYSLLDWKWDHNGFPVFNSISTSSGPELGMTSGRSTSITISPRLKALLGNKHWECTYLQTKASQLSSLIASSRHSSGYLTSTLHHSTLSKHSRNLGSSISHSLNIPQYRFSYTFTGTFAKVFDLPGYTFSVSF